MKKVCVQFIPLCFTDDEKSHGNASSAAPRRRAGGSRRELVSVGGSRCPSGGRLRASPPFRKPA